MVKSAAYLLIDQTAISAFKKLQNSLYLMAVIDETMSRRIDWYDLILLAGLVELGCKMATMAIKYQ